MNVFTNLHFIIIFLMFEDKLIKDKIAEVCIVRPGTAQSAHRFVTILKRTFIFYSNFDFDITQQVLSINTIHTFR